MGCAVRAGRAKLENLVNLENLEKLERLANLERLAELAQETTQPALWQSSILPQLSPLHQPIASQLIPLPCFSIISTQTMTWRWHMVSQAILLLPRYAA